MTVSSPRSGELRLAADEQPYGFPGAHDLFCDPRLVRDPVGELVTGGRFRDPRRDLEHLAQELSPAVVVSEVEANGGLIEQVLQIRRARNRSRR